jgi:hypothetical protein
MSLMLIAGVMLAGPALAGGNMRQADERYISTKLDCDNMSRFQQEVCLQNAKEANKQAKTAAGG